MKILALYIQRTLSILRRVQAPFSVLASRSHSFSFMQIPAFDAGHASGYDITILPNWVLKEEEREALAQAAQHTLFAYDLSDLLLLQIPLVRETMRVCRMVTVPNAYIQREVEIALPGLRVVVTPSCLDIPYLMQAHRYPRPEHPMIGCFGPYDWEQVKQPLQALKNRYPRLVILGDAEATTILGELVMSVEVTVESYPGILRQCLCGLTPIEEERGQDTIWMQEYGLLCKPVVKRFIEQEVARLLSEPSYRSAQGQVAHTKAKAYSAVQLADQYLKVYQKLLPILR
jgi:hypothetical protein